MKMSVTFSRASNQCNAVNLYYIILMIMIIIYCMPGCATRAAVNNVRTSIMKINNCLYYSKKSKINNTDATDICVALLSFAVIADIMS